MVLFKYTVKTGWSTDWLTEELALSTGFSQCVEQYFINRIRNPLEISLCEWFWYCCLDLRQQQRRSHFTSFLRVCVRVVHVCLLCAGRSSRFLFFKCLSCFHVIIESNHLLHIFILHFLCILFFVYFYLFVLISLRWSFFFCCMFSLLSIR